jgi:cysteinyl-tRNA synthetase
MAVQIRLYDSLSRAVQPVDTHNGHLTMYVCGITPYATTHLGHLFTYAMADILMRYLEDRGVRVTYVQNVTDIDEPLLQEAQKQHEPWQALGKRWTIHFIHDMQTMNIRPPTHYPRATEVIPDILASITRLLDAEVAYAAGGSVYFHVPAWPAYGTLSGLSYQDMVPLARARGHHADDPHTRHPLDFPLWQARQPGEPAWPSPWGLGRPGWHIECSTMAQRFLGAPIDIHDMAWAVYAGGVCFGSTFPALLPQRLEYARHRRPHHREERGLGRYRARQGVPSTQRVPSLLPTTTREQGQALGWPPRAALAHT